MDSRRQHEDPSTTATALDFVRFCHRRRRAGWPELYDEMCAVARSGLYHGWGFAELGEHGVDFGLAEMPRLAELVAEVTRLDDERRCRALIGVMASPPPPSDARDDTPADAATAQVFMGAAR
jgi:hypothetical protein